MIPRNISCKNSRSEFSSRQSQLQISYDITTSSPSGKTEPAKFFNAQFLLSYYSLIVLCLCNSLTYYCYYTQRILVLLVGITSLIICILFSLAVILREQYFKKDKFTLCTVLYAITGLGLIFSDPNIFNLLLSVEDEPTFASSLQSLSVLAVISINKIIWNKQLFTLMSVFLGLFSLSLNCYNRDKILQEIFQFFLYLILIQNSQNTLASNKVMIEGQYVIPEEEEKLSHPEVPLSDIEVNFTQKDSDANTGLEEVVHYIKTAIEWMNYIKDYPEASFRVGIDRTSRILERCLAFLRKCDNIYSTDYNKVTKHLETEDKNYISQYFYGASESIPATEQSDKRLKEKSITASFGFDETVNVLNRICRNWNFSVFMIDGLNNEVFQVCGRYVFLKYGLIKRFKIQETVLRDFLIELEGKYQKNKYHNALHAADVMFSFLWLTFNSAWKDKIRSPELLIGILVTLSHDVAHPGRTNRYLILSKDELATLYNDISVLEMHHASTLFSILKKPKFNILENIDNDSWIFIRRQIIELILATDMEKHFEILGNFKAKYLSIGEKLEDNDIDYRTSFMKMAIKAADVGHAAKETDIHVKWSELLMEEIIEIDRLEKSLGIKQTLSTEILMTDLPRDQSRFLKNIVIPLYIAFNEVLKSEEIEKKCITQLNDNEDYWKRKLRNPTVFVRAESFKNPTRHASLPDRVPTSGHLS
ncbi:unnamed protein product [Blepharisma stoltei]|uniref:Phosphodiesterase n=1 Tax=Blepharisma stoltei TaxID=1481888 RepID=A0AAU9JIA0_9CILI|nr:unnamed protein product [Blepharisma stoltei]